MMACRPLSAGALSSACRSLSVGALPALKDSLPSLHRTMALSQARPDEQQPPAKVVCWEPQPATWEPASCSKPRLPPRALAPVRVVAPLSLSQARPLYALTVEELNGFIDSTLSRLSQTGALKYLCYGGSELRRQLERPTPQFVHRVAVAINQACGFMPWIPVQWPFTHDAKLDLIWDIRIRVAAVLKTHPVDVVPLDILLCRNRERTRWFVQLMALAASKEWKNMDAALFSNRSDSGTSCGTPSCGTPSCGTPSTQLSLSSASPGRIQRAMSSASWDTPTPSSASWDTPTPMLSEEASPSSRSSGYVGIPARSASSLLSMCSRSLEAKLEWPTSPTSPAHRRRGGA